MARLSIFFAILLIAIPASAQVKLGGQVKAGGQVKIFTVSNLAASCDDGTDCFCDCLAGPDGGGGYKNATCQARGYPVSSSVLCEDFDNPSYDDGTGNAFVAAGWIDPAAGLCPDGPGSTDGDEGTDVDDCYNMVQDNNCDANATNTTTDCAIGNQSLGQKYDTAVTHGRHGEKSLPNLTTAGITIVLKYSPGYYGNSGAKNDELCQDLPGGCDTHGWPLGQDTYVACNGNGANWDYMKAASGSVFNDTMACTRTDLIWSTRVFFNGSPNCTSAFVNNATVNKGVIACKGTEWAYSPNGNDFPGGDFNWPKGDWACVSTKITGINTSNGSVLQKWMDKDGNEATVVDITGIDISYGQHAGVIERYSLNNYSNGGDGVASGYCTNAAGQGLGCDRGYRYEENLVITNGDPVPCSVAMSEIIP